MHAGCPKVDFDNCRDSFDLLEKLRKTTMVLNMSS
jgi:hypothetical protein